MVTQNSFVGNFIRIFLKVGIYFNPAFKTHIVRVDICQKESLVLSLKLLSSFSHFVEVFLTDNRAIKLKECCHSEFLKN